MALKYYLEYIDYESILHRAEIYDPDYNGLPIQVTGIVQIASGNVDSPIETIRGTGLKLFLDASIDLTFYDLYSSNDRFFKVTYTRDSLTQFVGFLNPEGLFENYVSDRWQLTLICADGLSFLKNLSYVDNDTNDAFKGKQSELDIITNCLKRTGLELNINTSIGISYTGQTYNTDVFSQTFLNAERFLKEDNQDTIMNCDEVLRSVLEKYNSIVIFRDGEWFILRPIELFNFTARDFYSYDYNGNFIENKTVDFTVTLGSQINGFYPHWANNNQQRKIKNAIGAYRINYKYGLVTNVLENPTLISDNGNLLNYTVLDPSLITYPTSEQGVNIFGSSGTVIVAESDSFAVQSGDTIDCQFVQKSGNKAGNEPDFVFNNAIGYRVKLTDGVDTYYLRQSDGEWIISTSAINSIDIQTIFGGFTSVTVQSLEVPIQGDISVEIQDSKELGGLFVYVSKIDIRATSLSTSGIKGEVHTFEKTNNPSSKILPNKTIYNGDIESDLYEGTIYKSDQTTPTSTWTRDGFSEMNPILRIMGEDTMSMFQSTSIEFSGDIYGFIPYMSRIIIDQNDGIYIPIEYTYNISTNVTKLKLRQIYGFFSGISYEFEFDYGNVVEPTIRG
jgi:hypothetical protein